MTPTRTQRPDARLGLYGPDTALLDTRPGMAHPEPPC
jgi:hypothetical protein